MKVEQACKIGNMCGLHTIGEAITNIELHAAQLFTFDKIDTELKELYIDAHNYDLNAPILGVSKCLMANYCVYSFYDKYCKADEETVKNCPYLRSIETISKMAMKGKK